MPPPRPLRLFQSSSCSVFCFLTLKRQKTENIKPLFIFGSENPYTFSFSLHLLLMVCQDVFPEDKLSSWGGTRANSHSGEARRHGVGGGPEGEEMHPAELGGVGRLELAS